MNDYNVDEIQLLFLKSIVHLPLSEFINAFDNMFNVKTQCLIFKIDRNRYNYLARTRQLDMLIMELQEGVKASG